MSYKKTVHISIDKIIDDISAGAKNAAKEICLVVEAEAKLLCHEFTGRLRNSITHEVESDGSKAVGEVGTNVEYAYYEDRRHPYLTRAIDQNRANMNVIIEKNLKKVGD